MKKLLLISMIYFSFAESDFNYNLDSIPGEHERLIINDEYSVILSSVNHNGFFIEDRVYISSGNSVSFDTLITGSWDYYKDTVFFFDQIMLADVENNQILAFMLSGDMIKIDLKSKLIDTLDYKFPEYSFYRLGPEKHRNDIMRKHLSFQKGTIAFMGSSDTLFISTDDGKTWIQNFPKINDENPSLNYAINSIKIFEDNSITLKYHDFNTGKTLFLNSTDLGVTWTENEITMRGSEDLVFYDDKLGFSYGGFDLSRESFDPRPSIYKTTDGGQTWELIRVVDSQANDAFQNAHIYSENEWYFVAKTEINYTLDAGKTWHRILNDWSLEIFPPWSFQDIKKDDSGNIWVLHNYKYFGKLDIISSVGEQSIVDDKIVNTEYYDLNGREISPENYNGLVLKCGFNKAKQLVKVEKIIK